MSAASVSTYAQASRLKQGDNVRIDGFEGDVVRITRSSVTRRTYKGTPGDTDPTWTGDPISTKRRTVSVTLRNAWAQRSKPFTFEEGVNEVTTSGGAGGFRADAGLASRGKERLRKLRRRNPSAIDGVTEGQNEALRAATLAAAARGKIKPMTSAEMQQSLRDHVPQSKTDVMDNAYNEGATASVGSDGFIHVRYPKVLGGWHVAYDRDERSGGYLPYMLNGKELHENTMIDESTITSLSDMVAPLTQAIKTAHPRGTVRVTHETSFGDSVLVVFSVEPREAWTNGIFENSPSTKLFIRPVGVRREPEGEGAATYTTGGDEQVTAWKLPKLRKKTASAAQIAAYVIKYFESIPPYKAVGESRMLSTAIERRITRTICGLMESGAVDVDEIGADELGLYLDNDYDLYKQYTTPITKRLVQRMASKQYDRGEAVKALLPAAKAAAQKYHREFGGGTSWQKLFNDATLIKVATEQRDYIEMEASLGNFNDLAGFSTRDDDETATALVRAGLKKAGGRLG